MFMENKNQTKIPIFNSTNTTNEINELNKDNLEIVQHA